MLNELNFLRQTQNNRSLTSTLQHQSHRTDNYLEKKTNKKMKLVESTNNLLQDLVKNITAVASCNQKKQNNKYQGIFQDSGSIYYEILKEIFKKIPVDQHINFYLDVQDLLILY